MTRVKLRMGVRMAGKGMMVRGGGCAGAGAGASAGASASAGER